MEKGGKTPSKTSYAHITMPDIQYRSHVQGIGWQGFVKNGSISGTVGNARRMESINIIMTDLMGGSGVK